MNRQTENPESLPMFVDASFLAVSKVRSGPRLQPWRVLFGKELKVEQEVDLVL